ncbi:MAG: hypothetical protein Q9221_005186 [Calogaya cf. arnoldii]
MTTDVKSIYHVDNDTMIGYHYTVVLFWFALCRWSQFTKIRPTPRATLEEQLHQKDAELARVNALNDDYIEIIESTNGQRALEQQELKEVTKELQWFCVNYPTLERANTDLQEKLVQHEEIKAELNESSDEACGLRNRLTRLTAGLPTSPIHTPSVGKVRSGGLPDISELRTQLEDMKGQKKDAVADKIKAEAERVQALSKEKKAVEESSRTATNLRILTDLSDKEKLEYKKNNANLGSTIETLKDKVKNLESEKASQGKADKENLGSTIETLEDKVKNLESEKASQGKALESSVANSKLLQSTIDRLERELKESKDDVKNTEKAARSSPEKDAIIQARDTTIGQLEGKIQTLNTSLVQTQGELSARKEELDRYKTAWKDEYSWHHYLQNQVDHLRAILFRVMTELNVTGHLNDKAGVDQAGGAIKRQIEESKSLYEQRLREVNHVKKLHDDLQQFKSRAESVPKSFSDRDEIVKKLEEAKEACRKLGDDRLKFQSQSLDRARQIQKLKEDLAKKTAECDINQKRNNDYTKKVLDLNTKISELQAKETELQNSVSNGDITKTRYEKEIQQLLEKKRLLEEQRAKLVRVKFGPTGESQDAKQSSEKRDRGDETAEDEDPRSGKQQKQQTMSKPAA